MADEQILVHGSADAPAGFTVPNTVEIAPKAVYALFDGTGASGDFQPLLEIVSDAGLVVAQSAGSTVTAGGSVEQSWFPRVAAAASAVGTLTYAITDYSHNTAVAPASEAYVGGNPNATDGFYTNTPDVFGYGSFVSGGNTYYGTTLKQFGNYLVIGHMSFYTALGVAGVDYKLREPNTVNAGFIALPLLGNTQATSVASGNDPSLTLGCLDVFDGPTYGYTIPSDPLVYLVHNYSGAQTIHVYVNTLVILLPGATATGLI